MSHEFKGTWNEPEPGLGLGPIIIAVVTFLGIALSFALIIGLGFGGFRIFMKNRYPNTFLGNAETSEMVQLKLIQEVTDRRIDDKNSSNGM